MRLLDTHTGQFVEHPDAKNAPPYAILSHVWNIHEQEYEALREIQRDYDEKGYRKRSTTGSEPARANVCKIQKTDSNRKVEIDSRDAVSPALASSSIWHDERLSPKIREACAAARFRGYDLIWIDSCCINKESSAELSEAINSMYRWYARAACCYAFLAEVPDLEEEHPSDVGSLFRKSKWFRRGWTLQELIAPRDVVFLSKRWKELGSKYSLADVVESITRIELAVLNHMKPLADVSVATRMSWAALRETTRVEDRAYSLFGIFGVNIPTLYGEGELAFRRLQLAILQQIPDQSIFAWSVTGGEPYLRPPLLRDSHTHILTMRRYQSSTSLLAYSPDLFRDSGRIRPVVDSELFTHIELPIQEYTSTPHGIRTEFPLFDFRACIPQEIVGHVVPEDGQWYLAVLACELSDEGEEHLLARVCYAPPPRRNLRLLQAGYLEIIHHDARSDLVLLSPAHIMEYIKHLHMKTVYIPLPERAPDQAEFGHIPNDVCVAPSRWANMLLQPRGYNLIVVQPFAHKRHPCHLMLWSGPERIDIHCWRGTPNLHGDMQVQVKALAIIPHSSALSAPHYGSAFWRTGWFSRREQRLTFRVEVVTSTRKIGFNVVLERMSRSRIVIYVRITGQSLLEHLYDSSKPAPGDNNMTRVRLPPRGRWHGARHF